MYCIAAVAYSELNKAEPDCGTTFTWARARVRHADRVARRLGISADDVIVMANVLLVGGDGHLVGARLPDSHERTVIAPDLSNLPPGRTRSTRRRGSTSIALTPRRRTPSRRERRSRIQGVPAGVGSLATACRCQDPR
jgi:hypothetical protein